ncbi:hypothetical protein [Novosphingobium gossypii]|uniref:hypothetical protein n=1 Tax=Novosphingobium gossypii TaxID=1604774 RepID=UPI003D24C0FB
MKPETLSLCALRLRLDSLEGELPGYWIDGPYRPTPNSGLANWQAMAYPRGPFDMAGLRHAKQRIEALKIELPTIDW